MEQFNSLDKDPQFSDEFRVKKKFHCITVCYLFFFFVQL